MTHPLDRPIWSALATVHAAYGEGDGRARRFVSSVSPFTATVDDAPESMASLARLAKGGDMMGFLQAGPVCLPDELGPARLADAVQMISVRPAETPADTRIVRLGQADIEAMLDLARLTNPGPLTARALELGRFWGIRSGERLVAMAGERLRQPGYTEVSGVCAHPDFRGQGLARLLSLHVASQIRERSETPYLHAYTMNLAAIRLYESIGFEIRSTIHVAMVDPIS